MKKNLASDAIHNIAERASLSGTGARALRGLMEQVMRDVMFQAPKWASKGRKAIRITNSLVDKALQDYA